MRLVADDDDLVLVAFLAEAGGGLTFASGEECLAAMQRLQEDPTLRQELTPSEDRGTILLSISAPQATARPAGVGDQPRAVSTACASLKLIRPRRPERVQNSESVNTAKGKTRYARANQRSCIVDGKAAKATCASPAITTKSW